MSRMKPSNHSLFLLFVFLLVTSAWTELTAGDVEFVIGGLTNAEGGTWDPKSGPLKSPFGVDFNPNGDMWIVELEGGRVHRLDSAGTLHHAGGSDQHGYSGDGGPLADATFNGMHNCAVAPNGDLFIGDSWNHCIRKVDGMTGLISTIAGTGKNGFSGDGGLATTATFDFVMCITLAPSNNVLHIADLNNRRIRAIDMNSGVVSTIAGNGAKGIPQNGVLAVESPLIDPRAVAQDSLGRIWILERGGHALRVVHTDGTIHTVAGTGKKGFADGEGTHAQFASPKHLCIDNSNNVYIADDENAAIRRVSSQSNTVTTVLGKGQGDPRIILSHPHGVTWNDEWLYIVDMGNNRILRMRLQ